MVLLNTEACTLVGGLCLGGGAWAVEVRRPFRLDVQNTEQGPCKATGGSQMNFPALLAAGGEDRKQCSQKNLILLFLLGEEVPTSVCYWKVIHSGRVIRTS